MASLPPDALARAGGRGMVPGRACAMCGLAKNVWICGECHEAYCNNGEPGKPTHIIQHLKRSHHVYVELTRTGLEFPKRREDQGLFDLHIRYRDGREVLVNRKLSNCLSRFTEPLVIEGAITARLFPTLKTQRRISVYQDSRNVNIKKYLVSMNSFVEELKKELDDAVDPREKAQEKVINARDLFISANPSGGYDVRAVLNACPDWRDGKTIQFCCNENGQSFSSEITYMRGSDLLAHMEEMAKYYERHLTYTVTITDDASNRMKQMKALEKAKSLDPSMQNWILGKPGRAFHPSGLIPEWGDQAAPTKPAAAAALGAFPEELRELNQSQIDAIHFAITRQLCMIKGPPGTGKTRTISVLVQSMVKVMKPDDKLLVCTPSNASMNHLFNQLYDRGIPALRVVAISQEARIRDHDELSLHNNPEVRELRLRLENMRQNTSYDEIKKADDTLKNLKARIVNQHRVVCCTSSCSASTFLSGLLFQHIIVDECTQGTIPETFIPMGHSCQHLILVGDDKQLPPTEEGRSVGPLLRMSLFELLLQNQLEPCLLRVQYRMHPSISAFSNSEFYGGQIEDAENTRSHDAAFDFPSPEHHILFLNAASGVEECNSWGTSFENYAEVRQIAIIVGHLLENGINNDQIGIITPYSAQKFSLLEVMESGIKVDTVDAFQGQEKDYIIFSCVRNNHSMGIGFLDDQRRLNVAITRARRGMFVVGSVDTLIGTKYFEWVSKCSYNLTVPARDILNNSFAFWTRLAEHYNERRSMIREYAVDENTQYLHARNYASLNNVFSIASFVDHIKDNHLEFNPGMVRPYADKFIEYLNHYSEDDKTYLEDLVNNCASFWRAMDGNMINAVVLTLAINDFLSLARRIAFYSKEVNEPYATVLFEKEQYDWCLEYCRDNATLQKLIDVCKIIDCFKRDRRVDEAALAFLDEESKIRVISAILTVDMETGIELAKSFCPNHPFHPFFSVVRALPPESVQMGPSIVIRKVENASGIDEMLADILQRSPQQIVSVYVQPKKKGNDKQEEPSTFIAFALASTVFFVDLKSLKEANLTPSLENLFVAMAHRFRFAGVNLEGHWKLLRRVVRLKNVVFREIELRGSRAPRPPPTPRPVKEIGLPEGSLSQICARVINLEISRRFTSFNWTRRPVTDPAVRLLLLFLLPQVRHAAGCAHSVLHVLQVIINKWGAGVLKADDPSLETGLSCECAKAAGSGRSVFALHADPPPPHAAPAPAPASASGRLPPPASMGGGGDRLSVREPPAQSPPNPLDALFPGPVPAPSAIPSSSVGAFGVGEVSPCL